MAANTGAKIMRDFFRESPCRMAYAITQQKVAGQQPGRIHQNLRRISSKKTTAVVRPQTAPIPVSNLARAVTAHNLMVEAGSRRRPTTSGKPLRPAPERRRDGSRSSKRPPAEDPCRRKSPCTSSVNVRKQPRNNQKQSKPSGQDKKQPSKPCKVCSYTDLWQDLSSDGGPRKQSDNLNGLVSKIEAIRSELLSEDGLKRFTFRDSVQLINEVRHRISSLTSGATRGGFLDRLEPSQTERMTQSRCSLRSRKSFKSPAFEGGRIGSKEYVGFRKATATVTGNASKLRVSCLVKPSRKKFEEGPLRMLFALAPSSAPRKHVQY